jgi:hypothetical protein
MSGSKRTMLQRDRRATFSAEALALFHELGTAATAAAKAIGTKSAR